MPRAVKLSVTKVASPIRLSTADQRSTSPVMPAEPCTNMTAGAGTVPVRGNRQHPGDADGSAVSPAGEELVVGQCKGGDGVDFGARHLSVTRARRGGEHAQGE